MDDKIDTRVCTKCGARPMEAVLMPYTAYVLDQAPGATPQPGTMQTGTRSVSRWICYECDRSARRKEGSLI